MLCTNKTTQQIQLQTKLNHSDRSCLECDFSLCACDLKDKVVKHKLNHTRERLFKCPICSKKFSKTVKRETHNNQIQTNEKPFECSICFKRFSQAVNMKTHKRIHSKEKPFECPFCFKRFSQSVNMETHKRIHTNEKPFGCQICFKRFAQKGNMQSHMRKVHNRF